MHRENLTKLLKALKSKKKLPAEFNMGDYSQLPSFGYNTCGSVGCLIGLSSYIIAPKNLEEGWFSYSNRIFNVLDNSEYSSWDFLFSAKWANNRKTNTKVHAIKRIEFVLKHGCAPKNWGWNWGI